MLKSRVYLSQYKLCMARIERLSNDLEEAEERTDCISINYDGMPHGTDISSKTENLAIRLADLELSINQSRLEALCLKNEIKLVIDHLGEPTEKWEMVRKVLTARYIENSSDPKSKFKPTKWDDVCEMIPYYTYSMLRQFEKMGLEKLDELQLEDKTPTITQDRT